MSEFEADSQATPLTPAESVYCRYLQQESSRDFAGFEPLCAENPELEADLRQLHFTWKRVASIRTHLERPPSFAERLKRRYGTTIDPAISLDGERDNSEFDGGDSGVVSLRAKLATQGGDRRYKMRDEVARGGMGVIYKVWDKDLRRTMAMKVVLPSGKQDGRPIVSERVLARFLEEAQITGQLDHPGIVPVHELGLDSHSNVYFTMRFVRGRDLKTIIDLALEEREDWSVVRVLGVIQRVCEAVAFAHSKGVVHRDLKPANIMVGRFGETYVMDWGLARVLGREDAESAPEQPDSTVSLVQTDRRDANEAESATGQATLLGDVVGTPSYMAPEQARGALDEVGPRSDVYSVGSILYQLLSGRVPYVPEGGKLAPHQVLALLLEGPPKALISINPALASEVVAICEKAMARDPDDRYPTMMALADDLRAYMEGEVVSAYESGAWAEFRKWTQRNRHLAAAVGVALLLAIGSLIAFAVIQNRNNAAQALTNSRLEEQALELQKTADLATRQTEIANEQAAALTVAKDELEASLSAVEKSERTARLALERADTAAKVSRQQSYVAAILAADYSLRLNDQTKAQLLLESCDRELRGWEWSNLWLRSDTSLQTYRPWDTREVLDASFAPGGQGVVCLSANSGLGLDREGRAQREVGLSQASSRSRRSISRTPFGIKICTSQSGSRFGRLGLSDTATPAISVFDTRDLSLVTTIDLLESVPNSICMSPFGELVASSPRQRSSGGFETVFYNAETGDEEARITADGNASIAISPAVDLFAAASENGAIALFRYPSGELAHQLPGNTSAVLSLEFSHNGQRLLSTCEDGTARIWNTKRGELVSTAFGHTAAVTTGIFTRDDSSFVTGSKDHTIRLWNTSRGTPLRTLNGHTGAVKRLALAPDGSELMSVGTQGEVKLWDPYVPTAHTPLRNQLSLSSFLQLTGAKPQPTGARFGLDGDEVFTSTMGGLIWRWDSRTGAPLGTFGPNDGPIPDLQVTPDGQTLVLLRATGDIEFWSVASSRRVGTIDHDSKIRLFAIRSDGQQLATSTGKHIQLWDIETREHLADLAPHRRRALEDIEYSPDGKTLSAITSRDLYTWNLARAGDAPESPLSIPNKATALAYRPDGRELAIGTQAGTVHLWNVEEGRHQLEIALGGDRVTTLAYHPAGTRIAVGHRGKNVDLWDTTLGQGLLVLKCSDIAPGLTRETGASTEVVAAQFSPDGQRLLTVTDEGRGPGDLRVWESSSTSERRLVISQTASLASRMHPKVDALYLEHFFAEPVRRALMSDLELTRGERAAGLRLVAVRGDDLELARSAWSKPLLSREPSDPGALKKALQLARRAARNDPEDYRPLCGASQLLYALGRYEEADEAGRASETRFQARAYVDPNELLELWVTRALTSHRLGEAELFEKYLQRLGVIPLSAVRPTPFVEELFALRPDYRTLLAQPDSNSDAGDDSGESSPTAPEQD